MWRIEGTQAKWIERFQLDVAAPGQGIAVANPTDLAAEMRLLRIGGPAENARWQPELVESYVRGQDCIATFAPTQPSQVQPQIYWRGIQSDQPFACGIEVMLSMQTSLLDSDPALHVVSELPAGDQFSWCNHQWLPVGDQPVIQRDAGHVGLFLLRPFNAEWSYLEGVFPSDFVQMETTTDATSGRISWSHALFAERLEKGVIRRGRVAGWILPREQDESQALAVWEAFCDAPPPLTA